MIIVINICFRKQLEIKSSKILDPAPKPVYIYTYNQTLLSTHSICLGAKEKPVVQLSF